MVEPVDPFERGDFDGLEGPPQPTPMDDLRLIEAVDCLGECVATASPTLPTDGSIPASASRSVYFIDTYWLPLSL